MATQQDVFDNYFGNSSTLLNNSSVSAGLADVIVKDTTMTDTSTTGSIPKLTAEGTADVDSFTDRLTALLDDTFEDGWGYFTMEEPTGVNPEEIKLPCIAFDVVHREPSTKKKGLKSRLTETIVDETDNNSALIVSRVWFDYIVEFMFFDKTNRNSRILMNRFETFFDTYKGFFKEQGVTEITFREEVDSRLSKKYKDHIPSTCLRYYMLMERISVQRVGTTKTVSSTIQATQSGSTTEQGFNTISTL